ncbi:MAG: hypothetical protein AAF297_04665 [Planctomycetota bacterium]
MSRKLTTITIAGMALGLGGVAMGQSSLDLERAYAAELTADAESRTSMLQTGLEGPAMFGITSADGASSLNIGGLLQMRYVANFRDDGAPGVGSQDDFTHGYELTRTRLDFTGSLWSPQVTYRVSMEAGDTFDGGGGAGDLNATYVYGQYDFEGSWDGLFVRFGTFKLPLYAEELIAPEFQQTIERSQTNEAFSQQYSTGFMFGYEMDSWAAYAAISDGINTAGTSFNGAESDVAITARGEYKISGDWAQFADLSSFRGSEQGLKVGAAIHYESYGDTGGQFPGTPLGVGAVNRSGYRLDYTADVQWEGNGWNVFGAFLGRSSELTGGGTPDVDATDFGFVVQGGYFFTEQWEGFARYDVTVLDDSRGFSVATTGSDEDTFNFLTFGANYYLVPSSHAAKFSVDVVFSLSETGNLVGTGVGGPGFAGPTSVTGLLGQNEDFEAVLRGQVQILF